MILRALAAILLLEAILAGGIFCFRYALDLKDDHLYYGLYHQEKVEREFWQEKVECAKKLNGCSKRAVERRLQSD